MGLLSLLRTRVLLRLSVRLVAVVLPRNNIRLAVRTVVIAIGGPLTLEKARLHVRRKPGLVVNLVTTGLLAVWLGVHI